MKKLSKTPMILCIILNGFCVVNGISHGENPITIALSAFVVGAALSALIFGRLLDEAHEQIDDCLELTRNVLQHSSELMARHIIRCMKGE